MINQIQIRYQITDKCLLNCDFCTIRNSNSHKYSNINYSFSYDSVKALKNILSLCDKEYSNIPISIGYYEECLLNEDIVLNILNVLKNKKYKHLLLSTGIKNFSKNFISYIENTNQEIKLSFGYKDFMTNENLKLCKNEKINTSLTLVYSPKSLKDVYDFVNKYKQLKTIKNEIQISLDQQYNENINDMIEYVDYTEYLLEHSLTNLHLIHRGTENISTIYIQPNGTIISMIPFQTKLDNLYIIKDMFCKRPSFCQSCILNKVCAAPHMSIYKTNNTQIEKFCMFMYYVYKKTYQPIIYNDINYHIIQKKYHDIKDYKTHQEWMDLFVYDYYK